MKIDVWSDFACPFCYIGEHRLEKAIKELNLENNIELVFHSYELNQNAIKNKSADLNAAIAKKYGISYESAKQNNDRIINMAKESGLTYRFDKIITNNTSLAHQASKAAKEEGKDKEFINRIFRAYFTEGIDINDIDILVNLGTEVSLDPDKLRKALVEKTFLNDVLEDEAKSRSLEISGVPFFMFNGKKTISGATSVENFKKALKESL